MQKPIELNVSPTTPRTEELILRRYQPGLSCLTSSTQLTVPGDFLLIPPVIPPRKDEVDEQRGWKMSTGNSRGRRHRRPSRSNGWSSRAEFPAPVEKRIGVWRQHGLGSNWLFQSGHSTVIPPAGLCEFRQHWGQYETWYCPGGVHIQSKDRQCQAASSIQSKSILNWFEIARGCWVRRVSWREVWNRY